MKSKSLDQRRRTLDASLNKSYLSTMNSTMTMNVQVKEQITDKYKTFARWNYKQSLLQKKKINNSFSLLQNKTDSNNMMNALMVYMQHLKQQNKNKKPEVHIQELDGIKAQRRQRLKKAHNPILIMQHYIRKEGFKPTEEQNILFNRIVKLKDTLDAVQPLNLQLLMEKLYKTMNIAVDLNQMKFFVAIIMLTADICYECKQFVRAVHFYTQAMISATCTDMFHVKVECFIKIGLICMELNEYQNALKFYKKALQYAWKSKDAQNQLRVYDLMGQSYYYQGNTKQAHYYHNRSIQGNFQSNNSAIKRISYQMLNQFDKNMTHSEKQNLSVLFIEYLNLPITNFFEIKPPELKKIYSNYIKDQSPRKNRERRSCQMKDLPPAEKQIQNLLKNCEQFVTELPNPQIQRNFIAANKYGKIRKEIQFQQSNQYHRLMGIQLQKYDSSILKLPLEARIDRTLSEKPNDNWWAQIVNRAKKQKKQKLGSLRNRVWNTHKKNQKYSSERKKAASLKTQKIKQSINTTLLNLVDPLKNS